MDQSPRNALSYLAPSQAQKHVTVNETFRRLDQLTHLSVVSASLAAEPANPADGAAWLLPADAAGAAWSAFAAGDVAAFQDGAWTRLQPRAGWRVFIEDEARLAVYDGSTWRSPAMAGVNAEPDATNRLAVKSDAALFSHDDATPGSGDCRVVVNRADAAATASVVFQSGFSGRAEFGLVGDDNLRFRTSVDGAAWSDVLTIDHASGNIGVGVAASAATRLALSLDEASPTGNHMVAINPSASGTAQVRTSLQRGGDAGSGLAKGAVWFATGSSLGFADYEARPIILLTGTSAGAASNRFQVQPNGNIGVGLTSPTAKLDVDGAIKVKSYLAAGAPSASATGAGAIIFVSDESGGATLAFSDGTNWRRVTDRAVIS